MGDWDGTITSKMRPIVTTLTEQIVKDFVPAYRVERIGELDFWIRTDEDGNEMPVNHQQLWNDVRDWLLGLEDSMETESDKYFATLVVRMVQKNPGWITLLTNRVVKRLS